ncbi:glycosyltransferase family 2 protein [Micromonospora tulbaghiae]|uniref:glycosyltransferase family 2 protein n=1 Tax=Micromonospora tulbaghiae TaxID=479978 RepID=UPI0033BCF10A
MSGDVLIGWVHPGMVHAAFMDSLLHTLDRDRVSAQPRIVGYAGVQSSANVSGGRNRLVEWFLDHTAAEWLLMVDTDMVWPDDALERLLAAADPDTVPVVGGLCFAREAATGTVWPTLFHLEPVDDGGAFLRHDRWPADTLMPVAGTGAAFLLLHRTPLEAVRKHGFSRWFPWFQETENDFGAVAEDLTLCLRLHAIGVPVHVHTGVEIGHVKPHTVTGADYKAATRPRPLT